ncbi:hypothetical protein SI65_03853 [Aspergillus cristatus]|uniref:Glycosyltransferase family 8 protein n=1 Tax=Aspergillus cristatus TaxID=573508 RepID=A0A1E3BIL4_ASPCR|nr:hypothetical protein SI65_03853 [Aspergillus cristatus]
MVLLTLSTASSIISMGVIFIFTFLLFLSGYVLQQQSVRSVQQALKPPPDSSYPLARHGSGSTYRNARRDTSYDQLYHGSSNDRQKGNNGNYAYVQLLSTPDPSNICSAILFFHNLSKNGTAVQDRLFMYPQEWDQPSSSKNKKLSKPVSKAISLLRSASIKYNIWLLPIDMTAATSAGYAPTDTKLLRLGQIQFMQYDSVLYVQTPGLLLDTGKLDDLFLSRPLPQRYDQNRRDSWDNEAWISMPLKAERDNALPPVYLVTVSNVGAGQVEARGHIPNGTLPGFGQLAAGPGAAQPSKDDIYDEDRQPGYVFFEHDRDGHVRWAGNPLYGTWRAGLREVCDGLDLDDDIHDDDL